MKRLVCGVLACLALVFCGIGFVGCEPEQPEIKSISIEKEPTVQNYCVGQDLQLTGGTLRIVFADDSVQFLPMTFAAPNIKTFTQANHNQQITLTYKNQTAHFLVNVEKGTLAPVISHTKQEDGKPLVTQSYTGQEIDFSSNIIQQSLPQNENISIKCFYKDKGSDDSTYTQTPKINAGNYEVKVEYSGSQNYNDLVQTYYFVINKANIKDLVLEGNTLDYNSVELNKVASKFGTLAQFSEFWTQSDGYLGDVPLPNNIKSQIEYSYRNKNSTAYNSIPLNALTGEHQATLDVGEYEIRIRITNSTNINDEVLAQFNFIVTQATLVRGEHYDVYLFDGTNETKLEGNTTITYDSAKTYSIKIKSNVGTLTLNDGTIYYLGNSSTPSTKIEGAGTYSAEFSITGNQNYKSTGRERITFTLE